MSLTLLIEKVVPAKYSVPVLLSATLALSLYVVNKVHAMDTQQAVINSQQSEILRRLERIETKLDEQLKEKTK